MKEKIDNLKKEIRILEWDRKLNQINFSKKERLEELKTELKTLENPV